MTERLELAWDGPLDPTDMDTGEAALAALDVQAVYACCYLHRHVLRVYVGRTTSFVRRLREHVAATLGLTYRLHDASAAPAFSPATLGGYFEALAGLDATVALAADEVRRMRWYHAPVPELEAHGLAVLEGVLIRHVRALEAAGAEDVEGRRVRCDNDRGGFAGKGKAVVTNRGPAKWVEVLGAEIAVDSSFS